MPARDGFPLPLEFVGSGRVCPNNFGSFPPPGAHIGYVANVYFGNDVVTLDVWLSRGPPYVQGRFEFGADTAHFAALVEGVPPCSGGVYMGRGGSNDFNLMKLHLAIEDAPKVDGYPRANVVELKLTPWPTSLGCKHSKRATKAGKGKK